LKPSDITTAVCGSLQFSATAYYSNGTTKDQSSTVSWASSNTSVASIDNTGLATGVGLGTTNIGVSLLGVSSATVPLEVDVLNSIVVGPPNPSLALGLTQAFTATGTFQLASGSTAQQDITGQVTWASSNPTVATIDNTGTATTVGQGSTTISATSCDGLTTNSTLLTVTPPAPQSLQVSPAAPTASTGSTVLFTAMELLSDGSTRPPTGTVTWSSDTTSVATIDAASGLAQALTAGTANITAAESGFTGSAVLTVQAATARFAYVANLTGGTAQGGSISSYTVDTTSATPLTALANTDASSPQQVLLHPSGHLLYYIDSLSHLHILDVNPADGSLTDPGITGPVDNCKASGTQVGVIDPTGNFIYVITAEGNCIFGFKINQTADPTTNGSLTLLPGFNPTSGLSTGAGTSPSWIMTDRTGKFLYVVNGGNNTIGEYKINSDGSLAALATPTIATGNAPLFGTTDTNGHLFVANEGTIQSVSAYTITATGTNAGQLTHIADTTITGATATINVLTDPTGKFLYVVDANSGGGAGQVFAYNLNPATGAITTQIGTAKATDVAPTGMAIDPTGVLLAVDNFFGNDISMYTVGTDGSLTPTTPPTVAADQKAEFVVFYTANSGQ
jgi:6-phosphogluconolactonase (cycloisomerase 2 family)